VRGAQLIRYPEDRCGTRHHCSSSPVQPFPKRLAQTRILAAVSVATMAGRPHITPTAFLVLRLENRPPPILPPL
jgi:hypothetical protein